ncbi:unnamed protein product, partial [Choristocarpus tenellus]
GGGGLGGRGRTSGGWEQGERGGGTHAKKRKMQKTRSAKNQIRSLTRLLNRPGLDEGKAAELRQQVGDLEGQIAERGRCERERSLAVKCHRSKFFDRRKSLRKLAQLHKKLQEDGLEASVRLELEKRRASEESDLKVGL